MASVCGSTLALMDGYVKNSIASAAELVTGEAQIHAEEYLEDHSLYKIIDNPGEIVQAAEDNGIGAVERTFGFGLVSSGLRRFPTGNGTSSVSSPI